jgi:hypothetical protein
MRQQFPSTKSFGPGHVVGAGILVLGAFALVRGVVAHYESELREWKRLGGSRNERGQYGSKS